MIDSSADDFQRIVDSPNVRQQAGADLVQPGCSSQSIVDAVGAKQVWLDSSTKLLLSLVEELAPKIGKTVHMKTKRKMWQVIKRELAEKGYIFSEGQIESKYRGLERQFKKTKLHNTQTGRNRKICAFER